MNPYLEDTDPNFWLSCILIDEKCKVTPLEILHKLNEFNVESRPLWKPMHMQPVFEGYDFISAEEKPVNEEIFARGLCLPSDIKNTAEDMELIISVVRKVFGK